MRTVTRSNTCAEALELIDKYDVRALPVVDNEGKVGRYALVFPVG